MRPSASGRRGFSLLAVWMILVSSSGAANPKNRVFSAGFEPVWTAAVSAAKDGFILDRASRDDRQIRFRTGPLRAYRFEVTVTNAGPGKTRVDVAVRTNSYEVERLASREADRYLLLVTKRLQEGPPK